MYISIDKNSSGSYPPLLGSSCGDVLYYPEEFENVFYENQGFVTLLLSGNTIIGVQPNTAAREAWIQATKPERDAAERLREIEELKQYLLATDYVVIKIAEGVASEREYVDIIRERQAARDRINELEAQI